MSQRKRENEVDDREEVDWVLYQRLCRDVCFLYHELAARSYVTGDLDYANIYSLPYWDHLLEIDTGGRDDEFLKNGLLMILLAMIWDELDESGVWISNFLPAVKDALAFHVAESSDSVRLFAIVQRGLELIERKSPADASMREESHWAHETFVRGYFRRWAQKFDSHQRPRR